MNSLLNSPAYLDALKAVDVARQISGVMDATHAQRELEKSLSGVLSGRTFAVDAYGLSHARDLAALHSMTTLQEVAARIAAEQKLAISATASLAAQSVLDAFGGQHAMREYTKALDLAGQVKALNLGFDSSYLRREATKLVEGAAALSGQAKAVRGLAAELEHARALASSAWVGQLSKSLVDDKLYKRFLDTLDIRHAVPSELWSSAAETAHHRYKHLFSSSTAWASQLEQLKRPGYLNTLLQSLENEISAEAVPSQDFFVVEDTANDDEVLLEALGTAETPERFAELLARSSKWLKWALISFLIGVVLPFSVSVSANLAMPHIEQLLERSKAAPREQIKEIRNLSMGERGIALKGCRFVTAASLVLRETPNSRGKRLDTMRFGQVVTVLSVKTDWTEVSYEYGDGQAITGWVFSRYLEKFRPKLAANQEEQPSKNCSKEISVAEMSHAYTRPIWGTTVVSVSQFNQALVSSRLA